MSPIEKYHFLEVLLTFFHGCVRCIKFVLNTNIPIDLNRDVLPMVFPKGIITLTLVISRESIRPTVRRGFYVMKLNIFRVKTQIECKIDEYIAEKAYESSYAAGIHKEVLKSFVKRFHYKNIAEIISEDIQTFYNETYTQFNRTKAMEAIRGFLRKFRSEHHIDLKIITNTGIKPLRIVGRTDTIEPIMKRKPGRPLNVPLVKRVKHLRDKEGLTFRVIAKAVKKDLKSTYRLYSYKIPADVGEKLSTE